ncbi:hypothetical protein K466DRAFT_565403 [Polyporus arcularius HHB13444]|uniref:DUF6593 domain-containing protein n=1 Tax=Polyporus arcularius HHB13444 TaxID=1314778 RepID=A0A5C3PCT3_9APHY|nr:hypothetical protein K466DRAFT_565403 [Polyporus arcularius HHB13444]
MTSYPQGALYFFRDWRETILNCTVIDNWGNTKLEISTAPPYTNIRYKNGPEVATIAWHAAAAVRFRDSAIVARVKDWLRLSNESLRTMRVGTYDYVWIPRETHVYLYVPDGVNWLARVAMQPERKELTLEMTSEAIQRGLHDSIVVATTLLFSGNKID